MIEITTRRFRMERGDNFDKVLDTISGIEGYIPCSLKINESATEITADFAKKVM